jgi:hypothetical protein
MMKLWIPALAVRAALMLVTTCVTLSRAVGQGSPD